MNDDSTYRGFSFHEYQRSRGGIGITVLEATRGVLSIVVHTEDTTRMPQGWTLVDVLKREIDKLIDPCDARGVDQLN